MANIKSGLGPDHIANEVNNVGDTIKNGIGPDHINSTVEKDGVIKTGLGPDHIEDTVDLIPATNILVSNKTLTWNDLPAANQIDNGSLTLLSQTVKDNVPVVVETGKTVERRNFETKESEQVPETVVQYETRAVYTYEADFDWDNPNEKSLNWLVDVSQFKNNQLGSGKFAFYDMPATGLTALPELDTSNLTNMYGMFGQTTFFNQPLDHFDTSNVTNMYSMFRGAFHFDKPLSHFDTSKVTSMDMMFYFAQDFKQDLSGWCVSQIDSKPGGFDALALFEGQDAMQPCWGDCGCPDGRDWPGAPDGSDDLPTTTIVVSNKTLTWDDLPLITNAHNPNPQPDNGSLVETDNGDGTYTYEANFIWDNGGGQHLDWLVDVLQFKNNQLWTGSYAFQYMPAAELTALPDLDTSNLTDISYMFRGAENFNQSLDNFDTSSATVMRSVFWEARAFNQPLNHWDISNVATMSYMFLKASAFNQPLDNWNTSNVNDMISVFDSATAFNGSLDNWDTSNVSNMEKMFHYASAFNQPLDHFNTSNVYTMMRMFYYAETFNQDISNWDTSNVVSMSNMFFRATNFNQDLSGWCVENVTEYSQFDQVAGFWERYYKHPCWGECGCPPPPATTIIKTNKEITWADLPTKDSNIDSLVKTNSGGGTYTYEGDFEWDNSSSPKSLYWLVDVLQFKNNQLKNGRHAFRNMPAIQLTALPDLDTSNLTDMGFMFYYAENFNQSLKTFETHNVTDMSSMFYSAARFNGKLDRWNTSNVTDMNSMFAKASKFNQSLDHFDTSNVTDMQSMFWEALVFNQPLNWDTSSVTTMKMMFCGSRFNRPIIFDTGNVTDMDLMFSENTQFDQPINFDTSNVTTMKKMFYFAAGFDRNISNWCVEQIPTKPDNFDTRAGFARQDSKQPQWGQPC